MSNDVTILLALFWGIAIILYYKWYKLNNRMKEMELITCKCTDTTLRTTYQKNIYIYYYTYIIDNEEYSTSDQSRFKLPFFNPKINQEFGIYVDSKNNNITINPLQIVIHKITLLLAVALTILPLLFFI